METDKRGRDSTTHAQQASSAETRENVYRSQAVVLEVETLAVHKGGQGVGHEDKLIARVLE